MKFNFNSIVLSVIIFLSLSLGFKNSQANLSSKITNKNQGLNNTSQAQKLSRKRILVIVSHPDDEILSCAKVISDAVNKGEKIKVLLMTNGDILPFPKFKIPFKGFKTITGIHDFDNDGYIDNVDYCYRRQEETIKANRKLGLDLQDIIFLGYPGGNLWRLYNFGYNGIYFNIKHPLEIAIALNPGTGFVSPYKNSYHSLAHLNKPTIHSRRYVIDDLKEIFKGFKPTDIYVHFEFDDNSDHKTTPLFVRNALQELKDANEGFAFKVKLHRYLIHFGGINSYPDPNNPRLGVRNDKNCTTIRWEDTKIGYAPNGSILLSSEFKKLKHQIIDYYWTQNPRGEVLQPLCSKEIKFFWMHQYVKDTEEWWDLPLDINTPSPFFDKLSLKDKIVFFIRKIYG